MEHLLTLLFTENICFQFLQFPSDTTFPPFLVMTIIPPPLILNFSDEVCDGTSTSRYTDYAMPWMVQGSNPSRAKRFLFLFSPKSPYQLCGPPRLLFNGYRVLPRGGVVKQSGCEVNHSPPSSAVVKNEWSYTCTSPVYLHGMDRENFSFILFTSLRFMTTIQRNPKVLHGKCKNCKWT